MRSLNICAITFIMVCSALTTITAQVPSYVPAAGLLTWYGFNGNGNNSYGTLNNATNYGATFTTDRFGVANAAADFNGTTAYMQVAAPSFTFAESGSFTYAVWINNQSATGAGISLMSASAAGNNFISMMNDDGGNQKFSTNMQGMAWASTACTNTLNTWTHYAATYGGYTMRLYKNGALQSTTNYTNFGSTAANVPLYIGKGFTGSNIQGKLDDIGIWNRALSAFEITLLYNSITGINDFALINDLSIAVAPLTSTLKIKAKDENMKTAFEIYNAIGVKVFDGKIKESNTTLDLSNLANGVYFFKAGETTSLKFALLR